MTAAPFSGNDRLRWLNCSGGGEVVMTSSFLCSLELMAHRQPATKIAHWDSLCFANPPPYIVLTSEGKIKHKNGFGLRMF